MVTSTMDTSTRRLVEKLRTEGRSYDEIALLSGRSKSCVRWHSSEENRAYTRRKRRENRLKSVRDMKISAGGRCSRCGYDKCLDALDFHHLDPSKKIKARNGSVTNLVRSVGIKIAIEEAKKCILLCSNCHREEHSVK